MTYLLRVLSILLIVSILFEVKFSFLNSSLVLHLINK